MSSGVLLLLHPIITPIDEREAIAALPPSLREAPRRIVTVKPFEVDLEAIESLDWQDARARQERAFRELVAPVRAANPDFRIHYFGMAPIPLAMHLGYLAGDLARMEAYLLHHVRRDWRFAPEGAPAPALLPEKPLPQSLAEGDVVVRVSVSHRVDPMDTRAVVPRPLCEIDLGLAHPGEDALERPEHIDAVVKQFDDAIDAIHRSLPNAERIHVFASVPVGLAFRLGARPNPTIHAPVVTYQFIARRSPRHERALILQRGQGASPVLTGEDRVNANALRGRAARELELIRRFGASHRRDAGAWWDHPLPERVDPPAFSGRWRSLAPLHETCLMHTRLDEAAPGPIDGFQLKDDQWQFTDELLAILCRRLTSPAAQERAMRMFLFHEGVHQTTHRLTRETSHEMRPFPRVLEELDYQGDVWAMVHEYGFSRWDSRAPAPGEARSAFGELIATAIETYWAFDDRGVTRDRFEIRRINRYLIWYWQALRISRASSLAEVLRILAERPLIEIAGPRTRLDDGRVVYLLDDRDLEHPELAVLSDDNRIHRFGHSPGSRVREVLDGFRARRSDSIASALKSIFDQVRG